MNERSLETMESLVARVADEFLECQKRGEHPDIEEVLARHPEAASTLRPVLIMLALAGPALSGFTGDPAVTDDAASGTLGDFRIVREVGRGGMGVVYEAEQISLRRRVALKVLPFASTMDPRRLQRFKNEAYAAASLHHEHIVPVHAVGCERGLHFYAMQFIDGRTLAQVLSTRLGEAEPDPDRTAPYRGGRPSAETAAALSTLEQGKGQDYFREVARLGTEAALALEHAHALGIVHRDIKPGNLMLDGWGKLWVTDFGLARLGDEPGVTASGDLLGTLRYMSPEQALARHGLVDHRTDVYSLGVTLYELVTLRPAVGGKDRQEVLKHIAFEEPMAPRKVNPAVPVDLETVVLKAMAKNPRERYATAKDLADDLQRWGEDRPVQARRPGLAQRFGRFARRHRAVVVTAAVGLAVALAALGASAGWVAGVARAREAATVKGAESALKEAGDRLSEDKPHEALAAALRAENVVEQGGGHARMQPLVEEMLRDIRLILTLEEARLACSEGGAEGFDAAASDAAYEAAFRAAGLAVLETDGVASDRIGRRKIKVQLAGFLDHWSVMRKHARGERDTSWRQLLRVARRADPDEVRDELREALEREHKKALSRPLTAAKIERLTSSSLVALATMVAEGDAARLVQLLRTAQQRRPGDFWLNQELALHLYSSTSRVEEAIGYARAAVAIRPRSGPAHVNLANMLLKAEWREEAVASCREAIRLNPDSAMAHKVMGDALYARGELDEAIRSYGEGIRLKPDYIGARLNRAVVLSKKRDLQGSLAAFREAVEIAPAHAEAHAGLGFALMETGNDEEAIAEYREAIRLNPDHAPTRFNLGSALQRKGEDREAIAEFRHAICLRPENARQHLRLGVSLTRTGDSEGAIASFREAARRQPAFIEAHLNLGTVLFGQRRYREALPALRRALELGGKKPAWVGEVARLIKDSEEYVRLEHNLASVLKGEQRPGSALEAAKLGYLCGNGRPVSGARLYTEAFAADARLAEDLPAGHRYNAACLAALAGAALGAEAAGLDADDRARWRGQALCWLRGDLMAFADLLRTNPKAGTFVRDKMRHWRCDPDLASVRDQKGLAKLDVGEQQAWALLWEEVDRLDKAIARPAAPAKKEPRAPVTFRHGRWV